MHKIIIDSKKIRTDLVLEKKNTSKMSKKESIINGLKCTYYKDIKGHYTIMEYEDITDKDHFINLQKTFKQELEKYLEPTKEDVFLVIGLGNKNSTPDSLGPNTLKEILVTRYLFQLGEVEEDYSNVSIFQPDVCGNTGIESPKIIEKIIEEVKPTKVILIDSLKASSLNHLTKTIQITDTGIHPGSGILNDQGEISEKTMHCKVVAIGVPTVVDMSDLTESKENFMVTPTNIDFLITRLTYLIGESINQILHPSHFRQIKK